MKKRGQAAMEFLMTYGWALLVVLVAIGALAFFGVLNPGKFLPDSCILMPGISCTDFRVTADDSLGVGIPGAIDITSTNGMGKDFDIFQITISQSTQQGLCNGHIGYLASLLVGGAGGTEKFMDGETKNVKTTPSTEGILCDISSNGVCCSLVNSLYFNPPHDIGICGGTINPNMNLCPSNIDASNCPNCNACTPPNPTPCDNVPTLANKKGEKFKADLRIVYREVGSSIDHQTTGSITTTIE